MDVEIILLGERGEEKVRKLLSSQFVHYLTNIFKNNSMNRTKIALDRNKQQQQKVLFTWPAKYYDGQKQIKKITIKIKQAE